VQRQRGTQKVRELEHVDYEVVEAILHEQHARFLQVASTYPEGKIPLEDLLSGKVESAIGLLAATASPLT
jgi:hypothetical protein